MRGAVLGAALCVCECASPAVAGLEAEIIDLLRSRGCQMPVEALVQVFAVMGHGEEEVAGALDDLNGEGEARVVAGRVMLSDAACAPPRRHVAPEAVPWIEGRLGEGEDCRLPRAALEAEAEAAGLRSERLRTALADLAALGRVLSAGGDLRLRIDLCDGEGERDWQLDRVLSIGPESYRSLLGVLAYHGGCRVDTSDPIALLGAMGGAARQQLSLGTNLSVEAESALRLRVERALADPGPAYRVEPGAIVARYCLP